MPIAFNLPLKETLPVPHASLVRTIQVSAGHHYRRREWSDERNGLWSLLIERVPGPGRLERLRLYESDDLAAEVDGR